jgi:hypothetical protein
MCTLNVCGCVIGLGQTVFCFDHVFEVDYEILSKLGVERCDNKSHAAQKRLELSSTVHKRDVTRSLVLLFSGLREAMLELDQSTFLSLSSVYFIFKI